MLHQAIDRDAALNHAYRYTVERVARLLLDGHRVEVGSGLGTPVTVSARDIFPPAVPQGLVAVADVEAGAIDLSWSPDADPDLAGYSVYRRVAGSTTPAERVSGGELLSNPAWRDLSPRSGLVYAYSVSAVDQTGNESARSAEALESVIVTPAAAPGKLPGQSSPHS
jgi:fibronectin type 3 domain-containing protein